MILLIISIAAIVLTAYKAAEAFLPTDNWFAFGVVVAMGIIFPIPVAIISAIVL